MSKKIIKLTESDLERIIKKVVEEDAKNELKELEQQSEKNTMKITEADLENIVKRVIDESNK